MMKKISVKDTMVKAIGEYYYDMVDNFIRNKFDDYTLEDFINDSIDSTDNKFDGIRYAKEVIIDIIKHQIK